MPSLNPAAPPSGTSARLAALEAALRTGHTLAYDAARGEYLLRSATGAEVESGSTLQEVAAVCGPQGAEAPRVAAVNLILGTHHLLLWRMNRRPRENLTQLARAALLGELARRQEARHRAHGLAALANGLAAMADFLQPCGCEDADDGTALKRCAEHAGGCR